MACDRQQRPTTQPAAAAGSCGGGRGGGSTSPPTVRTLQFFRLPFLITGQLGFHACSRQHGMHYHFPLPPASPSVCMRRRQQRTHCLHGCLRPAPLCRQKSPDETPLRDANRDRLMGLLTERWVHRSAAALHAGYPRGRASGGAPAPRLRTPSDTRAGPVGGSPLGPAPSPRHGLLHLPEPQHAVYRRFQPVCPRLIPRLLSPLQRGQDPAFLL